MLLFYTGMQAVGLKSFIERNPEVIKQLFPTRDDCNICAKEMKEKICFNDDASADPNATAKDFFFQYMDLIESRKEGE